MSEIDDLFDVRNKPLDEKFKGQYRAIIVETNDPLNIGRVRIKCPEMHDHDLKPDQCPWAEQSQDLGGKRAGKIVSPCIGDIVWVAFEKQHPYKPVIVGFAEPTRRKLYPYQKVHTITPTPVNENGESQKRPEDYDKDYLPKDGRPMKYGEVDRYGTMDIHSSVGFYPTEHKAAPPPPDHDAITGADFNYKAYQPEVNNPDQKYSVRVTKYGCIMLMSDIGYYWKKEGKYGEFEGDFEKDEEFEIKRWKSLQKILNVDKPASSDSGGAIDGADQRGITLLTRYGTLLQMRDTGWAQAGPIESKSRYSDFGNEAILSKESKNDYRWFKVRTKGGMLMQFSDKGSHPQNDKYIKRSLLETLDNSIEKEDEIWKDKDARWMRFISRYGYKIVIDDRGSDSEDATGKETPRANGILIKGRRSPSSKSSSSSDADNQRGFYWEFNENDEANHTSWGTPLGQSIEINDRYQYLILTSGLGKDWSSKWMGTKENEFIRKPVMIKNPEKDSHHLKIDHDNEYIRFKTRSNNGIAPDKPSVYSDSGSLNQGFEARDGREGDGPWTELVDSEHRGMWFSKLYNLSIWRAKENVKMYQWFNDESKQIVIYNDESSGKIQLYCKGDINLLSDNNINIKAKGSVNISGSSINMQANSALLTLSSVIDTNTTINAKEVNAYINGVMPGPGGGSPRPGGSSVQYVLPPVLPSKIEPNDRGKTYNGPYKECPIDEVEHKI